MLAAGSQIHPLPGHRAADILVQHLFAQPGRVLPGIRHAIGYQPADGPTGGDIVDVFRFNDGEVGFSITDISGKGVQAAIHAAMVKYALRAYMSEKKTAEEALRSLDRLFLENNAFEKTDAFASVFFGIINPLRTSMMYASAGHEPAMLVSPGGAVQVLEPTAPLVGVLDGQHSLFKQVVVELQHGTVFVGATDGVTEARRNDEFYGIERLTEMVDRHSLDAVDAHLQALLEDITGYCHGKPHDDIAILVLRIL